MTTALTVGSLFAGIGGIEKGLEDAGCKVIWQVENDEWCRRVLTKHWPDVPKYGDIREVDFASLERPDILAGGWPCQPCSVAGKQLGQQDARWLWPEFVRAIRILRPRYILAENVPGLLRRAFSDVLRDLAECGYDAEWTSLSAAAVGAPHIRERIWIVAYPIGVRQTQDEIFSRQSYTMCSKLQTAWTAQNTRLAAGNSGRVFLVPNRGDGGMADGLSGDMDRFGGLGNSVVPQCVQVIGGMIVEHARSGE
ncbi:MAG: DNA (cytosine-5-)-methyltransferase [Dehalococcoidia bacterium]|nr:DNA (cytosine-5-)-methyltransferase [Dehalococcoidia bacterium]